MKPLTTQTHGYVHVTMNLIREYVGNFRYINLSEDLDIIVSSREVSFNIIDGCFHQLKIDIKSTKGKIFILDLGLQLKTRIPSLSRSLFLLENPSCAYL